MRPALEFILPTAGREWAFQVRGEDSFDFAWHAHDFYELTYIAEGSGRRFAGNDTTLYQPGDLALLGPRLPHTYASSSRDGFQSAYISHFPGSLVEGLAGGAEFNTVRSLLRRSGDGVAVIKPDPPVVEAVQRLHRLSGARQTLALLEVLVELAEHPSTVTLASERSGRPITSSSADALTAVIGYLDSHFRQPVRRDDVAGAVSMSPSSVSRLIHRQLGTTLTAYVTALRVAAASRSLVDTELPIAEIAHACGFANIANFNRHFQRGQQLTPREYRRAFSGDASVSRATSAAAAEQP